MPIDYDAASQVLSECFRSAENNLLSGSGPPTIDTDAARACDALFASSTQAFRETVIGCAIARLQDRDIDIHDAYTGFGERAFSTVFV